MAENVLKKTLLFSNVESKELVDKIVSDQHFATGKKISGILESSVLSYLITENNYVRHWILRLYTEKDSIGEIIQSIFNYNSAGIDGKSRGLPLLKLLQFISFLDDVSDTEIDYTNTQEILYELNKLKEFCEEKFKTEKDSKDVLKK